MKQVVLRGKCNIYNFFTVQQAINFLRMKGNDKVYPYFCEEIDGYDRLVQLTKQEIKEEKDTSYYSIIYLRAELPDCIKYKELMDNYSSFILDINYIIRNRNDKELLTLVKQINDPYQFRIINIPDDVLYTIEEDNNGNEYILEAGRKWGVME